MKTFERLEQIFLWYFATNFIQLWFNFHWKFRNLNFFHHFLNVFFDNFKFLHFSVDFHGTFNLPAFLPRQQSKLSLKYSAKVSQLPEFTRKMHEEWISRGKQKYFTMKPHKCLWFDDETRERHGWEKFEFNEFWNLLKLIKN